MFQKSSRTWSKAAAATAALYRCAIKAMQINEHRVRVRVRGAVGGEIPWKKRERRQGRNARNERRASEEERERES